MFDNFFSIYILGRPGISGAQAGATVFISSQKLDREPFAIKFGYVDIFQRGAGFSQWGRNAKETQYCYLKVGI